VAGLFAKIDYLREIAVHEASMIDEREARRSARLRASLYRSGPFVVQSPPEQERPSGGGH
jgi:hypothetical protein